MHREYFRSYHLHPHPSSRAISAFAFGFVVYLAVSWYEGQAGAIRISSEAIGLQSHHLLWLLVILAHGYRCPPRKGNLHVKALKVLRQLIIAKYRVQKKTATASPERRERERERGSEREREREGNIQKPLCAGARFRFGRAACSKSPFGRGAGV